jgi:hypothetical protein
MRRRSVLGAVVLSVCVAASARADIITINPNAHAVGTDLSHLFPGVSMAQLTQTAGSTYNPVSSAVMATPDYYGDAVGSLVMGGGGILEGYQTCYAASQTGGSAPGACGSWNSALELTFDGPANFVTITAAWLSDGPGMLAYDSAGNMIGSCFSPFGPGGAGSSGLCDAYIIPNNSVGNLSTVTIARAEGDIARVVFGGLIGRAMATEVTYGVPEPATLALMGIGFAGAAMMRRRRRRTA